MEIVIRHAYKPFETIYILLKTVRFEKYRYGDGVIFREQGMH